jgi:ATP-dependent helicase/DNAse subunit B
MLGSSADPDADMTLNLVVGPPNAGRAGTLRQRFTDALDRDPVLVVPTRDDVDRFERELSAGGGLVGGSVWTFPALFEDVARATGVEHPPRLGDSQRRWLMRAATRDADLRILRASARSPGFAPAMDRLIDDLQASGIDPTTLQERARATPGDGAYESELAAIFSAYESLRDGLDRGDRHSVAAAATAALRAAPDAWGRRPVLLYGFDDLTAEQLELVAALTKGCDVTVAVTHEEDRAAVSARDELFVALRDGLGGSIVERLEPNRSYSDSATLFHLERNLFERPERLAELDPGLVLFSAAGERGEAEQIGGEIARLLDSGVDPDEIAVVLRAIDRLGPLYREVLSGLGIPVAVDARVGFAATATGRALLAVLRAAGDAGSADDVLAVLRAPARVPAEQVDWFERHVRRRRLRSAAEALEAWRERVDWEPYEIERLRGADPRELATVAAQIVREIAERPHKRRAARPGYAAAIELRAASDAGAALAEIGELPGGTSQPRDLIELLQDLQVPLWRGSAEGRVRVLSPYRVRARRVRHLFVASLQEGEFPSREPGDPLLGDDRRASLGLPERRDPELEERCLFYACVSRPSERLYLSWRDSDDDGQALAPSPFLDDIGDLLPRAGMAARRRGLDAVTFGPRAAPTADELARGLAALGPRADPAAALGELGVPDPVATSVAERLRRAATTVDGLPGPLHSPAVLGELDAREHYGASTLEEYALCSYRWFVRHELKPQSIEPDPEPLAQGAILHEVLERLYRDPPGGETLPRPGDLETWVARAAELLDEVANAHGAPSDALGRVGRRRMLVLLERFLAREADSETPLRPDPALIEASFGDTEHDDRPSLELGGLRLHGKIDRVDVAPDRRAGLVRDYKSGAAVTAAAKLAKEGKLQPQLYMLALRELWALEPIGGVYVPLAPTKDPRARGLLDKQERGELVDDAGFVRTDFLDEDAFGEALVAARDRAREIVAGMRRGLIDRDPIDDRCPRFCRFQPICRRERAVASEPPADDDDEEDET